MSRKFWFASRLVHPETIHLPSRYSEPRERAVNLLVVHAMGEWVRDDNGDEGDPGRVYHATDWINLPRKSPNRLSVHGFIMPDGRYVRSIDPEHYVAWHAAGVNSRAAGAEFLVRGVQGYHDLLERMRDTTNPPYTEAQYRTGGYRYRRWARTFDLPWAAVQGHEAIDPDRKEDPGAAFDWDRLKYWFDRSA